jgi:F0F1-type ATP synthase membrane subunit b/b'
MSDTLTNALATISLTPTDGVMILVCTVLIFVLYRYMATAVFAPLLEHVEERESVTAGALHAASQMRQKTEALKARFDDGIFQARVAGNTKRLEIVNAAKDQASQVIREAEQQAAKEISAGREAIARQLSEASANSETAARELAQQMAARVDSQLAA